MATWSPTNSGTFLPISFAFPGSVTVTSSQTTTGGGGTAVGGSGIFIPFSALQSYTVETSGDFREFVYSVIDASYDRISSINTALQAGGSGTLSNLAMSRSVDATNLTNTTPSVLKSYVVTSTLNVSGLSYDVSEE